MRERSPKEFFFCNNFYFRSIGKDTKETTSDSASGSSEEDQSMSLINMGLEEKVLGISGTKNFYRPTGYFVFLGNFVSFHMTL